MLVFLMILVLFHENMLIFLMIFDGHFIWFTYYFTCDSLSFSELDDPVIYENETRGLLRQRYVRFLPFCCIFMEIGSIFMEIGWFYYYFEKGVDFGSLDTRHTINIRVFPAPAPDQHQKLHVACCQVGHK